MEVVGGDWVSGCVYTTGGNAGDSDDNGRYEVGCHTVLERITRANDEEEWRLQKLRLLSYK